ncbi:MAG: DUF2281 domain-containing protein [Bacteroidota bacterium]
MSSQQITAFIQGLPEDLQQEVMSFLEYIRYKQKQKEESSKKTRGGYGIIKGKVWMAEDFDAPLEEFKDYM